MDTSRCHLLLRQRLLYRLINIGRGRRRRRRRAAPSDGAPCLLATRLGLHTHRRFRLLSGRRGRPLGPLRLRVRSRLCKQCLQLLVE